MATIRYQAYGWAFQYFNYLTLYPTAIDVDGRNKVLSRIFCGDGVASITITPEVGLGVVGTNKW